MGYPLPVGLDAGSDPLLFLASMPFEAQRHCSRAAFLNAVAYSSLLGMLITVNNACGEFDVLVSSDTHSV
ncbi:MAG: hypothetical protein ACREVZ_14445 [Burkholderiales bacterium]